MFTNKKQRILFWGILFFFLGISPIHAYAKPFPDSNVPSAANSVHFESSGSVVDFSANYTPTIYDTNSDLQSGEIASCIQTSDEYIWIGNSSGLFCFDGNKFNKVNVSSRLTSVTCLFSDDKNQLWIGTSENGVACYNLITKKIQFFTTKDGLSSNSVRCIIQDDSHNTYIGTSNFLSVISPEMKIRSPFPSFNVSGITSLAYNKVTNQVAGITNNGTLFYMENMRFEGRTTYSPNSGEYFNCVSATKDGTFFLGTSQCTICSATCKNGKITYSNNYTNSQISCINRIIPDQRTGGLFVCAENGAWYYSVDGEYAKLSINNFDTSFTNAFRDVQGNVWLASNRQGICKLSPTPFSDVLQQYGLSGQAVNAVCQYKKYLYIGCENGLYAVNKQRGESVKTPLTKQLSSTQIQHLYKDSKNNLWISTYSNKGLFCYTSKGKLLHFNEKKHTLGGMFRFVTELNDGTILAASNGGITFIKHNKVIGTLGKNQGLSTPQLLCAYEREDGTILAGSSGGGIFEIKDCKVVNRISSKNGLNSQVVSRIIPVEQGELYLTSNSIYYHMNTKRKLKRLTNFPSTNCYDIQITDNGSAWISNNSGILIVPLKNLLENKKCNYILIDKNKGFDASITANGWNYVDENGDYYICCNQTLKKCNLSTNFSEVNPIKLGVDHIMVNTSKKLTSHTDSYVLPANAMRFSIQPAILDYSVSNPLVHTYLEGFDDTGITTNKSNLTEMTFTNLSSGKYRFHIEILDEMSHVVLQEKIINIEKKPQFFEHTYFKVYLLIVCIFIISLFTWLLSKSSNMSTIRQQMAETQIARQEAERANAAKSLFLANMSHEIRTPINVIMGMNELILRKNPSPDIQKYATDINNSSHTLLSIVNDILDFSKIESGKMNIVCDDYDTASLLCDLASVLTIRANAKNLTPKIIIDEQIPKTLYGDETRIKQIIMNLLSNAIKYSESGTVTFRASLESIQDDCANLRFTVQDTGIGIKKEEIPKLFEVFQRLDEHKNSKIQGTGLGLSITKQLLFLMGSRIEVESEYQKGSTFSFLLSQKITDSATIGNINAYAKKMQHTHTDYAPSFCAPKARILVVDDNQMNLTVFKGLLASTKIQIQTALSGMECLDMICKKHYDIIFLDHMMPEMDGIETLHHINQLNHKCKDTPVIVLTANAVLGAKEMYLAQGFADYLSKPVTGNNLESCVKKYLPTKLLEPVVIKETPQESNEPAVSAASIVQAVDLPAHAVSLDLAHEIDQDTGLTYSGNSQELYQELLQMFHDDTAQKKTHLNHLYETKDWKNYEIEIHAIKSSAKSIGAIPLSQNALELEMAAKNQDIAYITNHHKETMLHWEKVAVLIEELLQDTTTSDTSEIINTLSNEVEQSIENLRDAIFYYNEKDAYRELDFLLAQSFPLGTISTLEKLQFYVMNSDWEKAQKLIKHL